jgi:nucleotide-binding universal stress UspA family protein
MLQRLVVPLDGSTRSRAILSQVHRLAADTSTDVLLLAVSEESRALGSTAEGEQQSAQLMEAIEWLSTRGVHAEPRFRTGDPASEIIQCALDEGADAIAMSTHARTGLDRLVHGSVSEAVIERSPVPVLLYRPDSGAFASEPSAGLDVA